MIFPCSGFFLHYLKNKFQNTCKIKIVVISLYQQIRKGIQIPIFHIKHTQNHEKLIQSTVCTGKIND
jgi:hypothetical protein